MSENEAKAKVKKIKSITVKLTEPIEFGEDTYTELTLRRPKAKDIEHLSTEPSFKDLLRVAQRCAAVPRKIIEELDSEDAMAVVEAVADFLDGGHQTGNKCSY